MNNNDMYSYACRPIGALILAPPEEDKIILPLVRSLPKSLKDLITSGNTGAYIRGLTKNHGLALDQAPRISLMFLRVVVGLQTLPQLTSWLTQTLRVAPERAQRMTQELERDLLTAVKADWQAFLAQSGQQTYGLPNVVDLRDQTKQ
jgi:hypothetical protein